MCFWGKGQAWSWLHSGHCWYYAPSAKGVTATRQLLTKRRHCCPRWHQDAPHSSPLGRPLLPFQSHGLVTHPHSTQAATHLGSCLGARLRSSHQILGYLPTHPLSHPPSPSPPSKNRTSF